ncbi:hypothetical protein lbkm_3113 [Lachnospiraceae bacterium KM106-2]|nr:hypothetical protein lbkm_3113 [Lachnospiraceae bacterium KM106-2]
MKKRLLYAIIAMNLVVSTFVGFNGTTVNAVSSNSKFTLNIRTNIAGKVQFKSSNSKSVKVNSKGKVQAKKGKATITATASNGKKATCVVTVK